MRKIICLIGSNYGSDKRRVLCAAFNYRKQHLLPIVYMIIAAVLSGLFIPETALAVSRLQEIGEKTVIVIDPGHGGENRGTIENNHEEKFMTMTTALAMYEELLLYDNVEVYLTHTDDIDMSLKERAAFARSVDADFLFSIHYNASANHELFGSEVWVSSVSPYNGYGYQFGYEFLSDMRDMGLLVRGVKTRLGSKGGDYYGIIRESVALDIPAVIIEHCHVDEARDAVYCDNDEKLKGFGKTDATAVARYFGLKSSTLGVDYSDYPLAESSVSANVDVTLVDSTEPDVCLIDFSEANYETGALELIVSASDSDSALLYYSYSLDGGDTFGPREAWPGSDTLTGAYDDSFSLQLTIPPDTAPEVIVRAYNMYDLYRESNPYISSQVFRPQPSPSAEPTMDDNEDSLNIIPVNAGSVGGDTAEQDGERGLSLYHFVIICLFFVLAMLLIIIVFQYIAYRKRQKRRLHRRKEAGDIWNQHK